MAMNTKIYAAPTTTALPASAPAPLMPTAKTEIWTTYLPDLMIEPNGALGVFVDAVDPTGVGTTEYWQGSGTLLLGSPHSSPLGLTEEVQTNYKTNVFISPNPEDPAGVVVSIIPAGGGGTPSGYIQIMSGGATIMIPSPQQNNCCKEIKKKVRELDKLIAKCCGNTLPHVTATTVSSKRKTKKKR